MSFKYSPNFNKDELLQIRKSRRYARSKNILVDDVLKEATTKIMEGNTHNDEIVVFTTVKDENDNEQFVTEIWV